MGARHGVARNATKYRYDPMRPGQQNKRSRGRNGRKNINPLSRNYESNGPDVKVRGNAGHIAEKYVQLARDATASSDHVMAENYLQHAEHYFRLISAAQAQFQQQRQDQFPGQNQNQNQDQTDGDGDDDDDMGNDSPARVNGQGRAIGAEGEAPPRSGREAAESGGDAGTRGADADDAGGEERQPRPRRQRRNGARDSGPADASLAGAPQPEIDANGTDDGDEGGEDEPAAAE
jgi:Domain of unknown function (DUF4167)